MATATSSALAAGSRAPFDTDPAPERLGRALLVAAAVDAAVRKIEETEGEGAAERARRAMTEALKAREAEAACSKHGEDK